MGIRVEYWEIPKGNIKRAITDDFEEMKEWYQSIGEEYPEDIDYDVVEIFESISDSEKVFEEISENKVDELVAFYLGDFCDYGPRKKFEVENTTFLKRYHYEDNEELINKKCNARTKKLWQYIMYGRSVVSDDILNIKSPVYRFSIFSEPECQFLFSELSEKFDTSTPEKFNKICGIGSVIDAIKKKKGEGILITVA